MVKEGRVLPLPCPVRTTLAADHAFHPADARTDHPNGPDGTNNADQSEQDGGYEVAGGKGDFTRDVVNGYEVIRRMSALSSEPEPNGYERDAFFSNPSIF